MNIDDYIISLFNQVPMFVYIIIFIIFILGSFLLFLRKGTEAKKYIVRLLFGEYIFFIYASTVIFRVVPEKTGTNFIPFSSYKVHYLFSENIMNIVVFVILGLLLAFSFSGMKCWKATLFGLFISVSIEITQLITQYGSCDVDDIINNTLGCVLGYTITSFFLLRVGVKSKEIK